MIDLLRLRAVLARYADMDDPPVRIWLTQHDWVNLLAAARRNSVQPVRMRAFGHPVTHMRYDMPSRVVLASGRTVRWKEILG